MSVWNEEKTYVNVSSTACIDWWEPSSGLLGAVIEPILNEGVELSDSIANAALNSPYCTWYHLARKNTINSTLGETIGTDLTNGLSKPFIEKYLQTKVQNFKSVESFGINAFLPLANVYNTLIDEYSFVHQSGQHVTTSSNGNNTITRSYIGTIEYQNTTLFVTAVGFDTSENKQCFIYAYSLVENQGMYTPSYGAPVPITYNTFSEVKIPLNLEWTQDQFLYVSYYDTNNVRRVYAENIVSGSEVLQKEYKKKRDIQYPTLVARKEAKSIEQQNNGLFKATVKATKRINLEWEDMVPQLNGDLSSLNKPTEKDREYANSIGDKCRNIYTTLAVDVTANSPHVKEYLYKLWKTVYFKNTGFILDENKKGGELNYSCNEYHHYIKYENITYTKKEGKVCRFKKYASKSGKTTRMISQSTGQYSFQRQVTDKHLYLYYQAGRDYYYEIVIDNPVHYTDAFNQDKSTSLPEFDNTKDFTKAEIRKILQEREGEDVEDDEDNPLEDPSEFIVPLYPVIVKQMGSIKGGVLLQIGLRNVWETKQKVKKKWWQSTMFMVIRYIVYVIIIVVVTIFTYGTGTAPTAKVISLVEILFQILISLAIKIAVKLVCKIFKIDAETESLINAVVDTARMMYAVSADSAASDAATSAGKEAVGAGTAGSSLAMATSIGNSLATMIINKDFSFEAFANVLGGIATSSLGLGVAQGMHTAGYTAQAAFAASSSAMTTFTLATSPSFYTALNQKKFNLAILTGMQAIASSCLMATSFVNNAYTESTTAEQTNNGITGNVTKPVIDPPTLNMDSLKAGAETFIKGLSDVGNAKSKAIQQGINTYNTMMKKLDHTNHNLARTEKILTAHNNDTVLKLLVNQSYYSSMNELARMYSLA